MDNIFNQKFYGFEEGGWHKKGITGDTPISAQEAYGMLTPYWFEKRPIIVKLNGEQKEIDNYAIVRSAIPDDPEEIIVGYAKKNYNIVQPQSICEIFDENVKQNVNTLGCLGQGERLFLTWQLPKIDVDGDEVKTYGFVAAGFDGLMGVSLYLTTVRVVCENTWMAAIGEAESAKKNERTGVIYSGRHNSTNVERDLGIWMSHVQLKAESKLNEASNIFNTMAKMAIQDNKLADELIYNIYPDPKQLPEDFPESLRQEKQEKIDLLTERAMVDRYVVNYLFAGNGTAIDATAWGLFNACTEYENHLRPERKDPINSIFFGNRAKSMDRAFNVISNWAKFNAK